MSNGLKKGALIAAVALVAGCSAVDTMDFYWQGAAGQMDLLARARPITDVIDAGDDAALAARLAKVREMRGFASRELGLPDNGSYTRYTDLGRQFVLWNVFAAPSLSLKPRQWCFPVAGCVNYRGYFREEDARKEAARLRADGDDVYVSGVPAYSTLGWFDDPVLSSFIRWPETEVARLIFHELAHQLVYVKDDSVFNESFAVAVEEIGLARWLAANPDPKVAAQVARNEKLRESFRTLVRGARERLLLVYASNASELEKQREKDDAFAMMKMEYERSKAGEPGLSGYDRWFAQGPNNASLAAVAIYTDRVPAFKALYAQAGNDLSKFYERVRAIAALPKGQRDALLTSTGSELFDRIGAVTTH